MEGAPTRTLSRPLLLALSLAKLVGFLFLHTVFDWIITMQSHVKSFTCLSAPKNMQCMKNSCSEAIKDLGLSRDDVEMMMRRMGMSCSQEGKQVKEYMGFDELADTFAEEPSLMEVKEAFYVFDEDNDRFIYAEKLQRVLTIMGFSAELSLEACRMMIVVYDENQDGRIDFNEFVKLMERSFC